MKRETGGVSGVAGHFFDFFVTFYVLRFTFYVSVPVSRFRSSHVVDQIGLDADRAAEV